MVNMNEIISNNIMNIMKQNDKKQVDLAGYLGVSKQVISKMLSGARMINAIELQKIAEFLGVTMERLVKVPQMIPETNTVKAFMGRVESQEAKDGLEIADEIANMICFYARTHENAAEMMQPWEA
ncbi:helix-turn-helix domain-containing protein [Lacrimispora sp. 210928-DFI.3.58]|uniref:helix-turn-helix domain-containing protein n=1 Tax=Lacrimispora sp. 210928-DFI.3.58 TaxID=2883214 RepID=UPI001D066E69|nr:helix-turn-helix transcriptional regulator [Lacrimispora sp. 210928-DFI.3.58]MCB7317735.1 helix-turn-helix domain-containing protein [Lacrimispora sp. 210928-DFI.3.58]